MHTHHFFGFLSGSKRGHLQVTHRKGRGLGMRRIERAAIAPKGKVAARVTEASRTGMTKRSKREKKTSFWRRWTVRRSSCSPWELEKVEVNQLV